jgi:hypothetical protein
MLILAQLFNLLNKFNIERICDTIFAVNNAHFESTDLLAEQNSPKGCGTSAVNYANSESTV